MISLNIYITATATAAQLIIKCNMAKIKLNRTSKSIYENVYENPCMYLGK